MKKIILFSVPQEYQACFKKLGEALDVEFIFYRKRDKKIFFSMNILRFFFKINFKEAISYSINSFEAKKSTLIPRFLLKIYFFLELFEKYIRYSLTLNPTVDYYICWNGKKPRHLIATQINQLLGIKIAYMENGLLPNSLVLDKKGVNFANSVPRDKRFFEAYHTNKTSLPLSLTPRVPLDANKFEQKRIPLPQKFIFVPFQVDYDSQILLYSPWIKDMGAFFNLLEEISRDISYHFVIKEHPSSKKSYKDLHHRADNIENILFINSYTTEELIQKSVGVLTINSTVGIESLLFKKKVIVVGDAFYTIEGITKGVKNKQELLLICQSLERWAVNENLIENFLNYLYQEYLISLEDCSIEKFKRVLFSR